MTTSHPRLLAAIRGACPDVMKRERTCLVPHGFIETMGEIRLEHVLRTLNKTKEWACASDGTFLESVDTDRFHHHDVRFDLTKPLSGQSPATLDWLEKVICET